MGYERRKFVAGLNDRSIKSILNIVNAERTRHQLSSEITRGIGRLISEGYLLTSPPYAAKHKLHDAFICHSSNDKRFTRRIASDLRSHGFKVWFDEFEMLPGDSLYEKIQNGIRTSSWFIVVLSPNSVKSKWCKRELYNALEEEFERDKVYVVPILYKECVVPGFLKEKVWANFQGKKYKTGFHQLLKRLSKK
ncbi:MAG: hypothetical protein QOJ02_4278 [Acidobacteriota bacterium]|jgi:hypothetical protein|nr:hypothetical protein [Acidobacteriota bacterium]